MQNKILILLSEIELERCKSEKLQEVYINKIKFKYYNLMFKGINNIAKTNIEL